MMNALSAATFGNFTYTDSGTFFTITGYPTNAVGAVAVQATINGTPVTSIGNTAFQYCTGLTSFSIGDYTFQYCAGFTAVCDAFRKVYAKG